MKQRWLDALTWLLCFALLWYLFSRGNGWIFALPVVLLATATALWLGLRPWYFRASQLPGFAFFFLKEMLLGAWDVARRAVLPQMPLQPAWVTYDLRADNPRVHEVCSAMVGLLPGTLASHLEGRQMLLHVLDSDQPWRETLVNLEQRLDRLLISVEPRQ